MNFVFIFVTLHFLFVIGLTLRILLRDDLTPVARLAWFIVIILFPYVGVIGYILFGEVQLGLKADNRHDEIFKKLHRYTPQLLGGDNVNLKDIEPEYQPAFAYSTSVEGFNTTLGNTAELMADASSARARMIEDFDAAKESIHVLYYIWLNDETGTNTAKALIRATKRGVKVRAMADALGSRKMLKSALWREMKEAGIETQIALPFNNLIKTIVFSRFDLRNHRKITVIDSQITYCGSQNCADPEFRVKPKYAPWIDIMMRLEGPVVVQNLILFASDWLMHKPKTKLDSFPIDLKQFDNGFPAQVFADGPTGRKRSTPQMFSTLLSQAHESLVISSPYFVPDYTVLNALCAAAHRGVAVTIIFPKRNDSFIVAAASRSYYRRLLESGVVIYEFKHGLLHSKTLTMDNKVTLIGSSNIDLRSFDLNYENNILLRDESTTLAVLKRQKEYISLSDKVELKKVLEWPIYKRLWNNVIATIGPVL